MSMRRAPKRSLQPRAEDLESRQLLSATFRGTDIDGDAYVLRLAGTGDLRVTLVNHATEEVTRTALVTERLTQAKPIQSSTSG